MSVYSSAVLALAPTSYYRMNATSGTTETDLGSAANNLTYTGSGYTLGGPGLVPSDPSSGSVAFSGAANTAACSASISGSLLGASATYGIICWISTSNSNQESSIACWNTAVAYQENAPGTGPGDTLNFSLYSVYTTSSNIAIPSDGAPHMLAIIYSDGVVTGFLDGASHSLGTISEAQQSNDTPTVGAVYQSGTIYYPFEGSIGDVAFIENLTAAQVVNLYALGTMVYVELNPAATQTGSAAITGPMSVASGYVPPVYNVSGAALASTTHAAIGSGTGTGSAQTITLSGAAVFSSATSYSVVASGTTGTVEVGYTDGANFTLTAAASEPYRWVAIGS